MINQELKPNGGLSDFIKIAFACGLVFATPSLLLLLGLRLIDPIIALILFMTFILLKSPIVGGFGWLIFKGSNGEKESWVLRLIGGYSGTFYCVLLGTFIVISSSVVVGRIVFPLVLIIGVFGGILVGPAIGRKML